MKIFRKTKDHSRYWKEREIDWETEYLSTWNHPHRNLLSAILGQMGWLSLFEVGCGPGPNLVNIVKHHPNKQVGGMDINPEAIEVAKRNFKGAVLKVGSVEDIMMSDNSTDIVLSDMCLIYVDKPDKAIKEIKRVARKFVVLCELHTESWVGKMKLKWSSGYNAHNYSKLLERHGFYDINIIKIPDESWPGGNPQKDYGFIIIAKVPKR